MLNKDVIEDEKGFTLVELVIGLTLTVVILTAAFTFFNNSLQQYLWLQKDGMSSSELAAQTQRIASVMRGATDVVLASNTEMTIYAYFSPSDTYVSEVHYYKSNDGTQLLAQVTPFTANPPNGVLDTSKTRVSQVVDDFYTKDGVNTFEYIDSSGNTMTLPITEKHTIKGLRINLVSKPPGASNSLSVQVSLRNRKTNL